MTVEMIREGEKLVMQEKLGTVCVALIQVGTVALNCFHCEIQMLNSR